MDFNTSQIRNISIAGHGQTGKTTLLEQLLFIGGAIPKPETVESGKTVSDYSPEEIEHKISINASLSHITWNDKNINIWDTPGSSDFIGEVISAFRSSEMALMLVDGRSGVQIETIKLWRDLDRRNKPRLVFINRCEEERSIAESIPKDIHDKFSVESCPVTIPMGKGNEFKGVIDVIKGKAFFVPDAVLSGAAAEGDEDLLVKFIDEGELTPDEIIAGLKIAFINNRIVPTFAGSTVKNCGLVSILDFIADIAPSPEEALETAVDANGDTSAVKIAQEGDMTAVIVKTSSDQFSGRLSYLKVITGSLNADTEVFNISAEGRKEKIGKIFRCTGKKLEEVKKLNAGDIGIAAKLPAAKTSDTLSSIQTALPLVRLRHPDPVYSMAVSAKDKKEEDKMSELLSRFAEEDRTIKYLFNSETKQNVLSGMGELQLNILLDKIRTSAKLS